MRLKTSLPWENSRCQRLKAALHSVCYRLLGLLASKYGFLGNTSTFRIYGWHHGLDHDSVHQRHFMVLRLAGWH